MSLLVARNLIDWAIYYSLKTAKNYYMNPQQQFSTLVDLLRYRAIHQAKQTAFIFLQDGEIEAGKLTYKELDRQARAIAVFLQSIVNAGDRAILLYPSGLEFIAAFFGCLYAGIIAVPVSPPKRNRRNKRLESITKDTEAKLVLTTKSVINETEKIFTEKLTLANLQCITTDNFDSDQADDWQSPPINSNTLALLQYTSGSTGTPKGVMVSHGNVLHNSEYIRQAFGFTQSSISVTWLPNFHDMGLIGGIIQPLYTGFLSVLLSPVSFLQKPIRWLQAISDYQGTHCGCPNFGYDLCVSKTTPEKRANLNLSSWITTYCGAEPIRQETIENFTATFESCGFQSQFFYPCYGMAEATLLISGGKVADRPIYTHVEAEALKKNKIVEVVTDTENTKHFVGCGRAWLDTKIEIVDLSTLKSCSEDRIGEIWVSSQSVAQGYWNKPDATKGTFQAHISNRKESFLRTGDLGFIKDDELFVTGRLKDLIIIRGQNHYPQDIEKTVEKSHPSLRPNCGAAFSVEVKGIEKLVVVQEVERTYVRRLNPNTVVEAISRCVSLEHELVVDAVVLLKPGSILKTSSGKIQRNSCRQKFIDGSLQNIIFEEEKEWKTLIQGKQQNTNTTVNSNRPKTKYVNIAAQQNKFPTKTSNSSSITNNLNKIIAHYVAISLNISMESIDFDQSLFALGIDSLKAIEILENLREHFQINIQEAVLFEYPTVTELSMHLSEACKLKFSNSISAREQTKYEINNINQTENVDIYQDTPNKHHQLSQTSDKTRAVKSGIPSKEELLTTTFEEYYKPFPLSDIQQAYWLGRNQNFDLGNIATHVYIELDCNALDLSLLNKAWQKLIEHHDMLRAVVLDSGRQQILEKVPNYKIELLDLQSSSFETIKQQLEAIRQQMSHEVLPSGQWPLFKIKATRLNSEQTRLHLSFDALIVDAWSIFLLIYQWQQLYHNPQTLLSPLEITFQDYIRIEQSLKETPQYKQSQEYWFKRNLPPAPELPFAVSPSTVKQPKFQRYESLLKSSQWQQFKQRAVNLNLTPSAALLSAFVDVLSYWSKSSKFTINLTLFNRLPIHPQVNQLVGDFTSLVLLEVDRSAANTFANRSKELQRQLWRDLEHRDVSGVEVQRELRRRYGNTQPMGVVFTSTLGLNSLLEDTISNSYQSIGKKVYSISQTPQVWLDHQIFEEEGNLAFNWDIVDELFPTGLVEEMFTTYCNWLKQLAISDKAWHKTNTQLPLTDLLNQQIRINNTNYPISKETLHSLFQKQAALRPQSLAVISPEENLTYQELSYFANKIAYQLQQLGATPNTLIAVFMNKGWEQIVAVLGILISGAAYLPIDPELPLERQSHLLVQGQVKLVLTQPELEHKLSLPTGANYLVIEKDNLTLAESNVVKPFQNPMDLAYVIYTSGSTGLPKGVMIDHQGAVNTILDINRRFEVGCNDRVLALSALNFDLSVYDIFGILAAGGTIVLPKPEKCIRQDPAYWQKIIDVYSVTIWNTVPALMQILVAYLEGNTEKHLENIRLVLLSGDWLPVKLPSQIKSLRSEIEVISLGGATEASIWSIMYPITRVEKDWNSIPYGKPMSNQHFYILDNFMAIRPTWVTGELYIGGIGLALGYWQDREKTNRSFVHHPVSGERLYRTGDLGRYLPSGDIEFLGREDFQVKINGYRIELGEIEAAVRQHSNVEEAVVSSLSNKLVAYIVPKKNLPCFKVNEQKLFFTKINNYIKQKLSAYMIPKEYILLDAFPLTPNGKIDRMSLPVPTTSTLNSEITFIPPRSSIEEQLAQIWSKVTGISTIGVCDNFFELGGDSLEATRITSEMRKSFHVEYSLKDFFENPTIENVAEYIELVHRLSKNSESTDADSKRISI